MASAYQYDMHGYYAGKIEDHGLLPSNATATMPEQREGYIPRWNGSAWEQVENHRGEAGWLNGTPRKIGDYGPYPDGWSAIEPEKSREELLRMLRAARDIRLAATDYLMLPDAPLASGRKAALTIYRQALRDLPQQDGAPWDGGGELTPWPQAPADAVSPQGNMPCA